jgi:hypothetical protein
MCFSSRVAPLVLKKLFTQNLVYFLGILAIWGQVAENIQSFSTFSLNEPGTLPGLPLFDHQSHFV